MKNSFITNLGEFLAVLSIVVNSIQFLLFSLVGIDYDPEAGTGLVAILNVSCCLYTVLWVIIKELLGPRCSHRVFWPYLLPIVIIYLFLFESVIFNGITLDSVPGTQLIFFGVFGVPSIYLATYIYRHDRIDMIVRNSDTIMIICTLALLLYLPSMLRGSEVKLGGAANHQNISYSAAFCFSINWLNIVTGNTKWRHPFFQNRVWKYIFWALLPLQALVCVLGGGRGGGVLMVLSFISIVFIFSYRNLGKTMLLSVATLILLSVVAIKSGEFEEGFGRTFNYLQGGKFSLENDLSDIERTELRSRSFDLISQKPVVGYGLWNGLKVSGYYMHNVFLDVLIAGGFVYLLFFIIVMNSVYKSAFRLFKRDYSTAVLWPWILYPSVMLMFSGYYLSSSYFWLFVILCLLNRKH